MLIWQSLDNTVYKLDHASTGKGNKRVRGVEEHEYYSYIIHSSLLIITRSEIWIITHTNDGIHMPRNILGGFPDVMDTAFEI